MFKHQKKTADITYSDKKKVRFMILIVIAYGADE